MNRTELTAAVAKHAGGDVATARRYLDAAIDTIVRRVADGERVIITGFGTFERAARAARTARHPQTGQPVQVHATNVARFTAGQTFKSMVASSHPVPATAAAPEKATVKEGKAKRVKPVPDTPAAATAANGKRAKTGKAAGKAKPAGKEAQKKPGAKKGGKVGNAKAK
jgi:DNA-binding protein HU-beta